MKKSCILILMMLLMMAAGDVVGQNGTTCTRFVNLDSLGIFERQFVYIYNILADDSLSVSTTSETNRLRITSAMSESATDERIASIIRRTERTLTGMTKATLNSAYQSARDSLPAAISDAIMENVNNPATRDMDGTNGNELLINAYPFCTDSSYEYSAGLTGSAESCPAYSCLGSQPAPGWYYLRISQAGNMTIHINSTPGQYDVDFCCWGPFTGPVTDPCQLTGNLVVDCSFSASWTEDCDITNAQVGEYYILLITNYSRQTTNVEFSKTAGSGTAETDCDIVQNVNLLVTVDIPGSGTTTGTGVYNAGRFVNCTVTPATGYSFRYWTHHDTIVSTSTSFTYVTSGAYPMDTLVAVLVPDSMPIASFTVNLTGDCLDSINLTNGSFVSIDGTTPAVPFRQCDYFIWDFGDGRGSNMENPDSYVYQYSGTYDIKLVAVLRNGNLRDSMTVRVTVRGEICDTTTDYTCDNVPYIFHGDTFTVSGNYDVVKIEGGCPTLHKLNLAVHPSHLITSRATICRGQSYNFRGRTLTAAGVYYDSLRTVRYGCDSVYQLTLSIGDSYHFVEYDTTCLSNNYQWRGKHLTRGGVHYDSLKTVNGCDSVYELRLRASRNFVDVTVDTLVGNGTYVWRGRAITEAGIYFDRFVTLEGCDSIYELRLTKFDTYLIDQQVNICEGDSFIYRGKVVMMPGIYYDSLLTIHGYDSVLKYIVNVMPTFFFYDTVTICTGDTYNFRGQTVQSAGDYKAKYLTVRGCDSVYNLHLIVAPQYHTVETDTACFNTGYMWRGRYLTASGTYYDTLKSKEGCDSIYELQLTQTQSTTATLNVTICSGSSYYFAGQFRSVPGVYLDTNNTNAAGCDSITRLVLSMDNRIVNVDTAYICQGDTLLFYNQLLTAAGNYFEYFTAAAGCDSVEQLVLQVNPDMHTIVDTTICSNDILVFGGTQITTPGTYRSTFRSACGCDSVVDMTVHIEQTKHTNISPVICKEDYYLSPTGQHLTETGVYYYTMISTAGCDSIVQVNLNVVAGLDIYDTIYICKGEAYYFRGQTFTNQGDYVVNRTATTGCDTAFHLSIRQNPTPHVIIKDTVCDGQSYTFGGRVLNVSGEYHDTASTIYGCDSILTLYLYCYDSLIVNDTATICETDSFFWHNRVYYLAGTYRDTLRDENCGCRKYCTLTLRTVKETKLISANGSGNSAEMCGDDEYYTLFPVYQGGTPTNYTLTYDGVKVPAYNNETKPFDGVSIKLPIPKDGEGNAVRPDRYSVTLQLNNQYCTNSPYFMVFELVVKYPSSVLEQHFNDMVSVLNAKYNGGYQFSAYEWYVNETLVYNQIESNLYLPTLSLYDKVYVALTRQGENYSVPSCPIEIVDLPDVTEYPVEVPRAYMSNEQRAAFVVTDEEGTYEVVTVTGVVMARGELVGEGETRIEMPATSGCYILVVNTEHYSHKTFKMVVK